MRCVVGRFLTLVGLAEARRESRSTGGRIHRRRVWVLATPWVDRGEAS